MTAAAKKEEAQVAANDNGVAQEWFTTDEAAEYMRTTPGALRKAIARGAIRPDCHGGRGRTRSHRFHVDTLRAYLGRGTPVSP